MSNTAREGKPGPVRRRRQPHEGCWAGGYVTAMADIMKLIESELDRTGDNPAMVLRSVGRVAYAAREVYDTDFVPREWFAEWLEERVSDL